MRYYFAILVLLGFPITSITTPMSDGDTHAFIVTSRHTCFKNLKDDPINKGLTDSQISQYCSCYANKASKIISNEDLKAFQATNDATIFNRARQEASDFCNSKVVNEWKWNMGKALESVSADKINMTSYKTSYVRSFMNNCNKGGLSDGTHDRIIDKLIQVKTQKALCTCEANKSFDLLSFDKLKNVITTNDKSLIEEEVKKAISFCMDDQKLLPLKDKLALGFSYRCKKEYTKSPGIYSSYEIDSYCACQGKRIIEKAGPLKNLEMIPQERITIIVKEAGDYCERFAF